MAPVDLSQISFGIQTLKLTPFCEPMSVYKDKTSLVAYRLLHISSFGACRCVRLYLAVCYLEDTVGTMANKSAYQAVSSTTMDNSTINYPGQHDFVVVASDGVRFNLSYAVLAITSGFFADMFTVGGASSSTQQDTVNAPENHKVLDSLFAISYSHPEKPKPNIETFSQIVELIQVADKYRMHHALDYLSSQLMLPRVQGNTVIQPFTVTHPLPTLSLSLTQSFSLPARLAAKEVVNATNSTWITTSGDAGLDSFTLDLRTLNRIQGVRNSRADSYKNFINKLLSGYHHYPFVPIYQYTPSCETCLPNWKLELLKKVDEAPNSVAFSAEFYKGWTCSRCGQDLVRNNCSSFKTFITSRAAEERTLPEL